MTIKDCIDIVDNIKPNQYTVRDKVMWLSFLDETIINDVLKTHEGYDGKYDGFEGYSEEKLSVPLVVPSPYDKMYPEYLKMQIDKENGEMPRYNNSRAAYDTYYMEYRKHYNKTHMPLDITNKRASLPKNKAKVGLTDTEYENLVKDLTFVLTEHFADTISEDKVVSVVNEYMQTNSAMFKGKDGYTPKKSVDYFTEDEVEEFKRDAKGDDGYSPSISVTETDTGHSVAITDANGRKSFSVANGKDGTSADVKVTEIVGGHRVSITDANGTMTIDVMNGDDGVSPTITVEEGTNRHTVVVQDAEGTKEFDVKDGVGIQGVEQTVVSTEDNGANLVTVTLTDGSQTSFRVRNGSKGSQGPQGESLKYEDLTEEQKKDLVRNAENTENKVTNFWEFEDWNDHSKYADAGAIKEYVDTVGIQLQMHIYEAQEQLGDIDTALDSILAIQNGLLGGATE